MIENCSLSAGCMQYLFKISIDNTEAWRLIAVDGLADLSHVAELISLSFDYADGKMLFNVKGKDYNAGNGGKTDCVEALTQFDSLGVQSEEEFLFKTESNPLLTHTVRVMKKDDHLFCLMPSCLVGSGLLPSKDNLTSLKINSYLDSEDALSLDLRDVTNRLRAYGSLRKDVNEALVQAGARTLDFVRK
mgnify:CR=1 FL=1